MPAERSKYENLELTPDQVMELAGPLGSLLRSDGWRAYQELLKGHRIQLREIICNPGNRDQYDHLVGVVEGLSLAESLPEMVVRLGAAVQERESLPEKRTSRGLEGGGMGSLG